MLGVPCLMVAMGFFQIPQALPPEANRMQADHAPTPFCADEIRRGCPEGRQDRFRIERAGQPTTFRVVTFTDTSDEGTHFSAQTFDAQGDRIGPDQTATATWVELQGHASFPAERTAITCDTLTTPAGTFDCWLYAVRPTPGEPPVTQRFWFARSLAGPPVRFEQERDGKIAFAMTLESVQGVLEHQPDANR